MLGSLDAQVEPVGVAVCVAGRVRKRKMSASAPFTLGVDLTLAMSAALAGGPGLHEIGGWSVDDNRNSCEV